MIKYYLFKVNKNLKQDILKDFLVEFGISKNKITFISNDVGYIKEDKSFYGQIVKLVEVLSLEIGINIFFLMSHKADEVSLYVLNRIYKNFKNKTLSLYEGCLYLINNKDYRIKNYLKNYFMDVDRELIITIYNYINNDLNGTLTSLSLYIHRNTFNYRLEKFIKMTSLDVRDFFNASFFLLCINQNII